MSAGNCNRTNTPRNVVVLLGGPGAGKGTQASILAGWLRIPHISTGQLLRIEAATGTELGTKARTVMDAGGLIGDEIVNAMVRQRIAKPDCANGFLLDGYPRDTSQAVTFGRLLNGSDRLLVIDIDTDLERVLPRLTGRRTCSSCSAIYHGVTSPPRQAGLCDKCGGMLIQRSDDHEDVIRGRFATYHEMTEPLTELYRKWGIYNVVDGMQAPEKVAADIRKVVFNAISTVPHNAGRILFGKESTCSNPLSSATK